MSSFPDPAVHSPAKAPETESRLAEIIASRNVHSPSLSTSSAVELTVIVDAAKAILLVLALMSTAEIATKKATTKMKPR